jgi:hypothetical protein
MRLRTFTAMLGIATLVTSTVACEALDWTPYVNERFGFSFRYPADLFTPERRSAAGDGEILAALRGEGRLLVGAFENRDGYSLAGYMDLIRRESYGGFQIDYTPRGATWFVLSGENGQDVFYEKVMFSCQGRIINSFSLIYPVESKRRFDPIIEGIEKTFRPGEDCGRYATR